MDFEKLIRDNKVTYPLEYRHFIQTGCVAKTPKNVSIETSSACQLSCAMCDRSRIRREASFMPDDVFYAVIDHIAPFRVRVNFNGVGEPLLDERLVDRIAYATGRGIDEIGLVTNGLLLTSSLSKELIKAGIKRITVSLDGDDQESHGGVHSGADYETVVNHIESLIRVKKNLNRGFPDVVLRVTVQKSNLAAIPGIFMRWRNKVQAICVNFVYQYGQVRTNPVVPYNWKEKIPCPNMLNSVMVLTNGLTTLCCMGDVNAELNIGNLAQVRLDNLYSGSAAKDIRARHLAGDFDSLPVCDRCAGCTMSSFYFGSLARAVEAYWQNDMVPKPEPGSGLNACCP
jgi:uncharacterized radical SAM superfamily Fe-S cluster-containing enzyme